MDGDGIRAALSEAGVTVTDDELGELSAAYPALLAWTSIVEKLALGAAPPPSALPAG